MTISFGNSTEKRGEITRGFLDIIDLPTGNQESLGIVIASGIEDGPTLLITANIHGNEVVGVIIIHRILNSLNLKKFKGRIVFIPSLNPTGHRELSRFPRFDLEDPNRKWPNSDPKKKETQNKDDWLDSYYDKPKLSRQEQIWEEIGKVIEKINPDFHVDLHSFSTLSIPFVFLDRVLFKDEKSKAEVLFNKTKEMVSALGLTIIVESPAQRYVKAKLHRSTSGFTLNKLRIPSCTIELGPMDVADPYARDAGITALNNLMSWAKMVEDETKPVIGVPVIATKELHRYLAYPITTKSGIADFQLNAGDSFGKDDLLVLMRNIHGEVIEEIRADFTGFVIGWWGGIAKYRGQELGMVAVPDRMPMITKWKNISTK